ncbi:hypothetical protein [Xanthobacter agilis]|uniref:Secreted protein n=1 Tax=Xanthobacter agilis TaxID=47492 RepID=A0ABU0LI45_XANAG|nr:hypothetical protein [Xanthobacter agilis]MDQ0506806.1 hypothetical protein [Xanthobacter agilis]
MLAAAVFKLAALFVGLAHKALVIEGGSAPVDMTADALPDGTLPEVCLGGDGGGDGSSHVHASPCDACVLTASPASSGQTQSLSRRRASGASLSSDYRDGRSMHGCPKPLRTGSPAFR